MEFLSLAGPMALGSRLRQLADVVTQDAEKIFAMYDVDINPRWFPVFYMLMQNTESSVSQLAEGIDQSHASVSQVATKMEKAGLVQTRKSDVDTRVSLISLTESAKAMCEKLRQQCEDVGEVVEEMLASRQSKLWFELDNLEIELNSRSLFERVQKKKTERAVKGLSFIPYEEQFQDQYSRLNEAWITQYFELEETDRKSLQDPEGYILNKGGYIALGVLGGEVVATCALIKMQNNTYELAKMTVDDSMRGLGVGELIGQHVIEKAKEFGAAKLYLESNTQLVPAIRLYQKLGFVRVEGPQSPYARCDIQMELLL